MASDIQQIRISRLMFRPMGAERSPHTVADIHHSPFIYSGPGCDLPF
jgi:hypothetical protein